MVITKKLMALCCLCMALLLNSGQLVADLLTLAPMQAHVVRTEQQVAVFYYLERDDSKFEVVSTVISTAENSVPIRQRVQLKEGQLYSFELDGGSTESATIKIKFEAQSDSLKVAMN